MRQALKNKLCMLMAAGYPVFVCGRAACCGRPRPLPGYWPARSAASPTRRRSARARLERQFEDKQASRARLALHPDFTAHHFNEARRDRESQSRTAVFARCGGVDLCEGVEQEFASLFGNSDPGVGYREAYDGVRVNASGRFRNLALTMRGIH